MTCDCSAGMCGCGVHGGYWFRLLRWIFAFVILVVVFMLGVKIGELKGIFDSRYGGYRMMGAQPYGVYPMMWGVQGTPSGTVTTSTK